MRNSDVPNYIQVNTRNETVSNRIPLATTPSASNVANWGEIPGAFDSSYDTKLTINNYSESTLSSANVSKMVKRI